MKHAFHKLLTNPTSHPEYIPFIASLAIAVLFYTVPYTGFNTAKPCDLGTLHIVHIAAASVTGRR